MASWIDRPLRFLVAMGCLTPLALAASWPAHAASPVCDQLRAERVSTLQQTPAGQAERFDRALEVQRRQLAQAESETRRLRCGFAVFGGDATRCASLNATIDRMQDNLFRLGRQREALVQGVDPARDRARIEAAMRVNGCGVRDDENGGAHRPRVVDARTGLETGGAPDDLSDSSQDRPPEYTASTNHIVIRGALGDADPDTRYRTMCVRSCDGYYFPMSYGVPQSRFADDERACQQRCPGARVALYYQHLDNDDPGAMMSLATGRPYRALPKAYLYRTGARPPASMCGCNATGFSNAANGGDRSQGSFTVIEPNAPAPPANMEKKASIPPLRIGPAGGLQPDTIEKQPQTTGARTGTAGISKTEAAAAPEKGAESARAVRAVGPQFLPDPSTAINLRDPGLPHDR